MPHMKQTATRTRRAAKQLRTILAVYSPHDQKTTVGENLNDWELFQHYENIYVRIVSGFLELKIFLTNVFVAKRFWARTVQLLFSTQQIILLQNNLVCYLEIIHKHLFFKKNLDALRFLHFARSPSACTSYLVDRMGPSDKHLLWLWWRFSGVRENWPFGSPGHSGKDHLSLKS